MAEVTRRSVPQSADTNASRSMAIGFEPSDGIAKKHTNKQTNGIAISQPGNYYYSVIKLVKVMVMVMVMVVVMVPLGNLDVDIMFQPKVFVHTCLYDGNNENY